MMIADEDFHKAWDRIARTPDGATIYLHLQKRLMGTLASNESGALFADEGERRFAAKLIGLMTKGIEETVGPDRAITFARAEPKPVARTGPRRLVSADQPVAGWDAEADGGTAS